MEPGETFGESVLFHDTYPSSTETMDDCRLYRFDTARVPRPAARAARRSRVSVLGAMARLMLMLNRRVEELLLPVPARLARYLSSSPTSNSTRPSPPAAAGGHGRAFRPGPPPAVEVPRVVKLPTSKRELAARLGTVPETLSRTFDRFKRADVIRMSGDGELIEILDFAACAAWRRSSGRATRRRRGTLATVARPLRAGPLTSGRRSTSATPPRRRCGRLRTREVLAEDGPVAHA